MEQKPLRLLFTSAGRRAYLIRFFQDALKGNGMVFAANSSPVSTALQAADKAIVTPLIYDEAYIPFLLRFCREQKIDALMSLFDIDLPVLAAHKAEFAEKNRQMYLLLISERALKNEDTAFLGRHGFSPVVDVIKSYNLRREDFLHFIRSFRAFMHGFVEITHNGFMQRGPVSKDETYLKAVNEFLQILKRNGGNMNA